MKCSRAYVSKILSGNVNFTFPTAARFAKAVGMDLVVSLQEPIRQKAKKGERVELFETSVELAGC